jgi:hypothetical protein
MKIDSNMFFSRRPLVKTSYYEAVSHSLVISFKSWYIYESICLKLWLLEYSVTLSLTLFWRSLLL